MSENINAQPPRSRGIYLLPNLFTTVGLFTGFFAIVAAMKQHFDSAAIAIFISMIMDFLDGRVARLTNTQTAFGTQYDSLSDMVAFGLAPSLVVYRWALDGLGKFGWLVCFIYTAAVALRLARFNTQIKNIDKRYFQGLPSPSGAAIIASFVWLGGNHAQFNFFEEAVIALGVLFIAALMVSNIRYNSFKDFEVKDRIPFVTLLIIVVVLAAIAIDPPSTLFVIFAIYGLSGPIITLIRLRQARKERKKHVRK